MIVESDYMIYETYPSHVNSKDIQIKAVKSKRRLGK